MSISWDDFIDRYSEWSESTLRTRISELDEIGSGDEVVDVVLGFPSEQLKGQHDTLDTMSHPRLI